MLSFKFSNFNPFRKPKSEKGADPVFNRPLELVVPHHQTSRVVYALFLSIMVLISIPLLVLKGMSHHFIMSNHKNRFAYVVPQANGTPARMIMAVLPKHMYTLPPILAIVSTAICLLLALVHLGFLAWDWKEGTKMQAYAFRRNAMFLHITNTLLLLFALVAISVVHKCSPPVKARQLAKKAAKLSASSNSTKLYRYDDGTFDLESWACQLGGMRPASAMRRDFGRMCEVEIAGRVGLIVLQVVAGAVAGLGVWGLISGGRRGPDGERMKTDEIEFEMGKLAVERG